MHYILCLQKREVEFDKYQMDKLALAKNEFRSLLKETKLITYKSLDLVGESAKHYKDIIDLLKVRGGGLLPPSMGLIWISISSPSLSFSRSLSPLPSQNDRRYLVLECVSGEREDILYGYLEDIQRRGPPPPPTATNPGERLKRLPPA